MILNLPYYLTYRNETYRIRLMFLQMPDSTSFAPVLNCKVSNSTTNDQISDKQRAKFCC